MLSILAVHLWTITPWQNDNDYAIIHKEKYWCQLLHPAILLHALRLLRVPAHRQLHEIIIW